MVTLPFQVAPQLPRRWSGTACSIAKRTGSLLAAQVLVSAAIDELLELAIGDLGLVDPVVRELHPVVRAAGDEDHARATAAGRAQPDRARLRVRPARGRGRRPDFEPRLQRL